VPPIYIVKPEIFILSPAKFDPIEVIVQVPRSRFPNDPRYPLIVSV